MGSVGLIGGAVRDLALQSLLAFKSDLDFVLYVEDRRAFTELVSRLKTTRNAFGGYRAMVGRLQVDFWEAGESWAHLHGHYHVTSLADVRHTTFFNLDALIYDVGGKQLFADEATLEDLIHGTLDINLRPNPNEDGAAIRALRRLRKHGLKASSTLIDFLSERIDSSGWDVLIRKDREAYPHAPVLGGLFNGSHPTALSFSQEMKATDGRLLAARQYELDLL